MCNSHFTTDHVLTGKLQDLSVSNSGLIYSGSTRWTRGFVHYVFMVYNHCAIRRYACQFTFYDRPRSNWQAARSQCQQLGADLLRVDSLDERVCQLCTSGITNAQ